MVPELSVKAPTLSHAPRPLTCCRETGRSCALDRTPLLGFCTALALMLTHLLCLTCTHHFGDAALRPDEGLPPTVRIP